MSMFLLRPLSMPMSMSMFFRRAYQCQCQCQCFFTIFVQCQCQCQWFWGKCCCSVCAMFFLGFFFFELIMMSCEFQNSTKDVVTQRKIWNWTELCKGLNVCLTNKTNGFYGTFSCKRFPTATATYGRLRRLCDNTPTILIPEPPHRCYPWTKPCGTMFCWAS